MALTRAAIGEWFLGLENRSHRVPALGLMVGRFLNVVTALIVWLASWHFSPASSFVSVTLITFALVAGAYLLLLPRVFFWRMPVATTLDLLFLDLAAVTCLVANSGGLSSPFLWVFLFPLLAAYFYENRALVDLSVGGVLLSLLIVAVAHLWIAPVPLTGPALTISPVWAWQMPILLMLLGLVFFANRRSSERRVEAEHEMDGLRRRLTDANEELTRSFYDLESALDRGRASHDHARHARQQLLRAERFSATGKLAAGILHDMTNPLSVIISDAELFFMRYDDRIDKARDTLNRVLQNAQHLSQLVDNLHLLTKQRSDVIYTSIDVKYLIMHCLAALESERKRRGVVIDTIFDENAPKIIGIESQLEQMIVDLLINSFEAMHHPGGHVTIRTQVEPDALRLEIEDDGEGIEAQHLEQIFEPFFSTRGMPTSLGLGLYSVRAIVQEHNGTVSVRSQLDVSTRFTITLPNEPARQKEKTG